MSALLIFGMVFSVGVMLFMLILVLAIMKIASLCSRQEERREINLRQKEIKIGCIKQSREESKNNEI